MGDLGEKIQKNRLEIRLHRVLNAMGVYILFCGVGVFFLVYFVGNKNYKAQLQKGNYGATI